MNAGTEYIATREEIVEPFDKVLIRHGLTLVRAKTRTLQINVGYLCDLACRHCHLEAGPHRTLVMTLASLKSLPEEGISIPTGDHCYSCTAGSGFT